MPHRVGEPRLEKYSEFWTFSASDGETSVTVYLASQCIRGQEPRRADVVRRSQHEARATFVLMVFERREDDPVVRSSRVSSHTQLSGSAPLWRSLLCRE